MGGTKGFSTKQNAVSKYYITADDRASCVRELRAMANVRNKGFWHSGLTAPRIRRDEKDVQLLYEMMEESFYYGR